MASVEFDSEASAMYVRLKKGKVDRSEPLADNVIIGINKNGVAIGIEILLPEQDSKTQELISKAFKIVA